MHALDVIWLSMEQKEDVEFGKWPSVFFKI